MRIYSEAEVDAGIEGIFQDRNEGHALLISRLRATNAFNAMKKHYDTELHDPVRREFRAKAMGVLMTKRVLPRIEGFNEGNRVAIDNESHYVTIDADDLFYNLRRLPAGFSLTGDIMHARPLPLLDTAEAWTLEGGPDALEYVSPLGSLGLGMTLGNIVVFTPDGEALVQKQDAKVHVPIEYRSVSMRSAFPQEIRQ